MAKKTNNQTKKPSPPRQNDQGPAGNTASRTSPIAPPTPSSGISGGSTNQQIQKAISTAGNTVSYKEAAAVAAQLGVSVDRVYNQTAKTGQDAKAGAAAANAGYVPTSRLQVSNPISPSYVSAAVRNATATSPGGYTINFGNETPGNSPGLIGSNPGAQPGYDQPVPAFDWGAWQTQMVEQQAAVWASMDAMNAQFLQQQEDWQQQQMEQRSQMGVMTSGGDRRGFSGFGSSTADPVKVKRKKKVSASAAASGTQLSIGGGPAAVGVSTGGASAGKTLGIG